MRYSPLIWTNQTFDWDSGNSLIGGSHIRSQRVMDLSNKHSSLFRDARHLIQLDSNKQKTKLIKLTGATATNAAPNKPSDKTKQQTLHKQNQTWQWKHIKLNFPLVHSIFVLVVNFSCELLCSFLSLSSSFPSISHPHPPSSSISCLFFYVVDSTNLLSWPLSEADCEWSGLGLWSIEAVTDIPTQRLVTYSDN